MLDQRCPVHNLCEYVCNVLRSINFANLKPSSTNAFLKPQVSNVEVPDTAQTTTTYDTQGRAGISVQHHVERDPEVIRDSLDAEGCRDMGFTGARGRRSGRRSAPRP